MGLARVFRTAVLDCFTSFMSSLQRGLQNDAITTEAATDAVATRRQQRSYRLGTVEALGVAATAFLRS